MSGSLARHQTPAAAAAISAQGDGIGHQATGIRSATVCQDFRVVGDVLNVF